MPRPQKAAILVFVHPGSACGSANFNLGYSLAHSAREILAQDLDGWNGPILVIDGSLSDEIKEYPRYDTAIKNAIKRARKAGQFSKRVWGCDDVAPHQNEAIRKAVAKNAWNPKNTRMELTGCWATRHGNWGCVNGVYDELVKLGFETTIRDSAVYELEDDEDAED